MLALRYPSLQVMDKETILQQDAIDRIMSEHNVLLDDDTATWFLSSCTCVWPERFRISSKWRCWSPIRLDSASACVGAKKGVDAQSGRAWEGAGSHGARRTSIRPSGATRQMPTKATAAAWPPVPLAPKRPCYSVSPQAPSP